MRIHYILSLASVLITTSCATVEQPKVSPTEQVQRDYSVGTNLARKLEPELKIRDDKAVQAYLQKLGRTLAVAPTDVLLVGDQGTRWRNFGLPTSRLYL